MVGVLGVAGVGPGVVADAASVGDSSDEPTDAGPAQQNANGTTTEAGEGNGTTESGEANATTNVTIPVTEAMSTAQNETAGIAVGAELTRDTNVTDLERPTMVYEVDVLLDNNSVVAVDVNATDGSVREVRRTGNDTGLLEGLLGGDDGVPRKQANASSIRSAVEAVELLRNQTGVNATVTTVELGEQDGQLRYTVETVSAEGIQSTAVIAANPDEGGVLTTQADEG